MGFALAERQQIKEAPFFNKRGSLAYAIDHFRRHWQEEGLPYNWRDLPGTGFQMQGQMRMLAADLARSTSTDERRERFVGWLAKTDKDIRGFGLEYLCEGLVFPITYRIALVGGQERLIAPLYGNKLMVDTVSSEERNGAVKKSLVGKIEPFLLKAPEGSIAVMTSPSGWSGMKDNQGRDIVYPDSQTYILQKRGNEIVGFTIRTDFTLKEHSELLRTLKILHGLDDTIPSEHESVAHFVETIVRVTPSEETISIKDVVDTMRIVRLNTSTRDDAYKKRQWEEVYRDLKRGNDLWQYDKRVEAMIAEFTQYVLSGMWTMEDVEEALAVTILRIARFLRGGKGLNIAMHYAEPKYGDILKDVQSIPGCAGGGSLTFVDSISPRHSTTGETLNCVTCPFCQETVDAILTEDAIVCPKCNKSASRE